MLATPRPERQILRVADLQAQLNLSRTTIWRLRRAGQFPQPIRLSANAVGWPVHLIDEWLAERPRRDRMSKPETVIQEARTATPHKDAAESRHPVSEPPSPLSPAATTLDAVASPPTITTITAPAASAAEALEPCERAILSVLRLWPRGAAEAAVAHRAGLDATAAAVALRRLLDAGLAVSSEETPPARRLHERIVFWRLAGASATAALMADVPRPDPAQRRGPQGPVPDEFWHHFCSGSDPAELRLPRDATLVGCRLIESFDSEARSWVLSSFTVEQLAACHSRYPDPSSEAPELIAAAIEALS